MTTTTAKDASFLEQVDLTTVVDLHKSNILRMEMEELVKEVSLKLDIHQPDHHSLAPVAHEYLTFVSQCIEQIDTTKIKFDPKCPFAVKSDVKVEQLSIPKLRVVPKTHGLKAMLKPSGNANVLPTLELQVRIPNSPTLDQKDYMRNRWFHKRNMIVYHVFQQLHHQKDIGKVYWRLQHNDERKVILLLTPPVTKQHSKKKRRHDGPKQLHKIRFRVLVTFATESLEWIPPLRLLPNRCNLQGVSHSLMYNHALMEDLQPDLLSNLHLEDEYVHFHDAWVLLQVWSRQRGLICHDGLSHELIGLMLLYLYRTKQATPRMAATQLLSVFFKMCAETNWIGEKETDAVEDEKNLIRKAPSEAFQWSEKHPKDVLVLPQEDMNVQQTIAASELARRYAKQTKESPLTDNDPATLLELYRDTYDMGPVFLDPSMTHNLMGRVSPSFCRLLQHEGRKSLHVLNRSMNTNQFLYLFMSRARFWDRYDAYLRVPLTNIDWDQSWAVLAPDMGKHECVARAMIAMLHQALGNRVQQLRILSTGNGDIVNDPVNDSDNMPTFDLHYAPDKKHSLLTDKFLVIGVTLNADNCTRVVDRGPPADDLDAKQEFLRIWGSRAELRRFKDGAIVHAVVWESSEANAAQDNGLMYFQNQDSMQGGIVERIVHFIVGYHFCKDDYCPSYSLRKIQAYVDTVLDTADNNVESKLFNPISAHKRAMKVFDELSEFLRKNSSPSSATGPSNSVSRLGIPLPIEAVEPLSPCLRYVDLFPPVSHPLLGGPSIPGIQKVSGAIQSDPIRFQVRFGQSSKWPQDLKAMGAAKTAMLIQLSRGIESMVATGLVDGFEGSIHVTPSFADIPFRGFIFRMYVRADPELKVLQELSNPNPDACRLLENLHRSTVVASRHHSLVHTVYTGHPSSSSVVRLAKRWVSSHLLSDHLPFEAIELLVVKIYADSKNSALDPPSTIMSGFMRFLRLLSSHDWLREPLLVDPHDHLREDDMMDIRSQFEEHRGPEFKDGPPMFIISPCDRQGEHNTKESKEKEFCRWLPTFTTKLPELVTLARAVALAKRSYDALLIALRDFDDHSWPSIFHETSGSFRAFSALLRIDADFMTDEECSSTGSSPIIHHEKDGVVESSYSKSMRHRFYGPKELRRKLYRNLIESNDKPIIYEWNPVSEMVRALRSRLDTNAVFFYNDLCPEIVAVLWRPVFRQRNFSVVVSEYVRPITNGPWKPDTLVTINVRDLLREITQITSKIVIDQKIFDLGPEIISEDEPASGDKETKRKSQHESTSDEDSEESN